jgi:hypothetical protein
MPEMGAQKAEIYRLIRVWSAESAQEHAFWFGQPDHWCRVGLVNPLPDSLDFKPMRLSLDQTIRENADRLGHTSSHTLAVFVQLLTTGKVRFSFRAYTKRLELLDKSQVMGRPEAILLVESCLSELRGEGEQYIPELTQNIIIQTPKPR